MKNKTKVSPIKKNLLLLLPLLFFVLPLSSQINVKGKVISAMDNQPLTDATIKIKGATGGTTTDEKGNFTIEAESDDILEISYVGFLSEEIPVDGRDEIVIAMVPDVMELDEYVVVGYGTQREKDLTSAIVTVNAEEIARTPTSQAMQSLQGKVPGVQIVSSGAPGSGPTVRVRGIGSLPGFGNSDPLYVVDGMFFDNIDFLNTSDIRSISVLKDASAAAIYGVRAANGVILIETISGDYNQEPEIVYNGYYGLQVPQNVLQMANTQQFTQYIRETGDNADLSFIENSMERYGTDPSNPNLPAINTNWYDEVMRNGAMQNHSLKINGGSERVRYSLGANYFQQEGLMKVIRNEYERFNFRTKIDFRASDRLKVGGNVNIGNATQYNAPDAVWFSTYSTVPTLPVYDDEDITTASPVPIANAQNLGYRGTQNPFFLLHYNDDRNNIGNILGNFEFDYDLFPDKLKFNMSYNYNYETINTRNVNFAHNTGQSENTNSLFRQSVTNFDQVWDNILTYNQDFGNHRISLMGGYSFRSEQREGVFTNATEIQGLNREQNELWFISSSDRTPLGLIDEDNTGDIGGKYFGTSYLARLSYNYDERYLLYGTFRRDGTNKFQAKWGNFFTIGAGWVITEESFFNISAIDYLKIRGSWGELGNDAINPAVGQPTRSSIFMAINDTRYQGLTMDNAFDLVARWETVEESNIGLSARFLQGDLSLEADLFRRDTKDAVTLVLVPGQRTIIRRSLAGIRNSGFEMSLNYMSVVSDDLSFSIGGNFATLNNEVLDLGPGPGYLDAGSAEFRQRSIVGEPIESFYGYEILGVFQNKQEVENSGYTQEFIDNFRLEPGDFFYKDQNGDGVIDSKDRVLLGSFLPKITYGSNLTVNYNNFSLSLAIQGQAGHKILNRKRGEIIWTTDANIDAELAENLWRGDGTTNNYTSASGLRKGYNQAMSDYYVEDGDYFRIQNIQFSYEIPDKELMGVKTPKTRIIFTAERPLTFFDYNGFNPEVANGIDRQTYPIPAIYTLGLDVRF
ncbi:MAG: SusC/RagA family TonB-linked outer membrane protein [Bacteroidota bacterium]